MYGCTKRKNNGIEGWGALTPTLLSKFVKSGKKRNTFSIRATNLSGKQKLDTLEAANSAANRLMDVLRKIDVMRDPDKNIKNADQAVEDRKISRYSASVGL